MYDGIVLGLITYISFVFSFLNCPTKVKRFLLRNPLLSDALSVSISFILLTNISKSIVAVIAAMICGLLVNITINMHQRFF